MTKPPQRAQTERKHYSTQAAAVAAAREHLQKLKGNATVRRSRLPPKRLTPPASSRGWGRAANRDRLAALSTPRARLPPLELHPGQTRSARHVDEQRLEALSRPVSKPTKPEMSDPHSGKTLRVARLEQSLRHLQKRRAYDRACVLVAGTVMVNTRPKSQHMSALKRRTRQQDSRA